MMAGHRRVMLEEATLRKMKGLLATSNRLPPWSSAVDQYSQEQVNSGEPGFLVCNLGIKVEEKLGYKIMSVCLQYA